MPRLHGRLSESEFNLGGIRAYEPCLEVWLGAGNNRSGSYIGLIDTGAPVTILARHAALEGGIDPGLLEQANSFEINVAHLALVVVPATLNFWVRPLVANVDPLFLPDVQTYVALDDHPIDDVILGQHDFLSRLTFCQKPTLTFFVEE